MKSTPGIGYIAPTKHDVKEYTKAIAEINKEKYKNLTQDEASDDIIHIANKLSGGEVSMEEANDMKMFKFINGLDPVSLDAVDGSSYLDYATYIKYKMQQMKDDESTPEQKADEINQILKDLQEAMQKKSSKNKDGEFDEPTEDDNSDGNTDNPNVRKSNKNNKFFDDSEKDSVIKQMLDVDSKHLDLLTRRISLVMNNFVPEIGINYEDLNFDIEGEERIYRQNNGLEELHRIPVEEFAKPKALYISRALENGYSAYDRASGCERMQYIYLLLDASGSMNAMANIPKFRQYSRIDVAREIAIHFANRVKEGKCEVMLRIYTGSVGPLKKANDPKSADKLIKYLKNNFNAGGDNDTSIAMNECLKDIELDNLTEKGIPEILLITDGGEDNFYFKVPNGIILNYINVNSYYNVELEQLCTNKIQL